MRTVAFHTLGCKLNFSETSTIARQLITAGYKRVEFKQAADVYVINTCSVTDQADASCRNAVRQALKANPNAFVAVIGCYAQLKPKEIAGIEGVDIVLGANEKFNIINYLETLEKAPEASVHSCEIKDVKTFVPGFSSSDRTRTFLKIQDGCDYFCSFCTIPLARGRSRSENIANTIHSTQEAIATGVKEIVLTGVNIGDFGADTDENLIQLIQRLDNLEGSVERFRISSIEPNLLSDEIILFCATSKRFVPHFHIPLQSGSDAMLKKMRRRYDSALHRSRVEAIKQNVPHACIGVDVIVGHPGETEDEFLKTYEFLRNLPISYLHVFTYSERPNTTAVREKDEVIPVGERKKRNKMLTILSEKKKRAFYDSFVGTSRPVLFEHEQKNGYMLGYSDNYLRVRVPFDEAHVGKIRETHLNNLAEDGIFEGEILITQNIS
ncbi:MAG: tRNA (N(6)-L-threonylcarbamoyladenosine(37)-C(2))-methylthiotransferase MtaB [Flavobacteriales bacterium]|jgi:threonylcarbamoyladenosine tRNA methylthiotransferase MtaB|nr:tRNA (N(6)-L-threonylcarbamoyladenosine(37)-C(2))-methylthiotransferase MtaB [Flavobacteriales bacterium]